MKNEKKLDKDDLYQILDRNTSWIENCDSKASIILGGIGVIIAIFLSSEYVIEIKKILEAMFSNGVAGLLYVVLGIVTVVTIFIGLMFLVRVLLAKINVKEFKERGLRTDSKLFFSSIAQNKIFKDYKTKLENCSETALKEDIISQIYICSQICTKKFEYYRKGLILTVIGVVSFSIILFIGVISIRCV